MQHRIDCSDITQSGQLHQILCDTLQFPKWYGHNLDALYDCLTDITDTTVLIFQHWNRDRFPTDGFEEVLRQAEQENPNFSVLFQ